MTSAANWPLPINASTPAATCSGLSTGFSIQMRGFADDVTAAAALRYQQILFAYGPNNMPPPTNASDTITSVVVTVATADDRLRFGIDESYVLNITANAATIAANTVFGALWGLETFSQLVQRVYTTNAAGAPNGTYYCVSPQSVSDAPRFPYRGLLLDTSRHFLSVTAIKQVIDLMSYLKMNGLHIHFTDDQSWPVFIDTVPELTNLTAYSPWHVYSPADLKELVQFGRLRGVIVYPEIDLPEHSATIYEAFPAFGCSIPNPPNPSYLCVIDPTYPQLWPLLTNIFGALDAIFPKEYPFHVGGDEVENDCWTKCPNAIQFAKQHGWDPNNGGYIYRWFEYTLYNLLRKNFNRTVIMWEDVTGLVDGNWTNVTEGLVLEQWDGAPGTWQWDACDQMAVNPLGVIVSGPFSILSTPQVNYVDVLNVTCPVTPKVVQQSWGPEIMLWDDAQDSSGSDIIVSAMQTLMAVAESGWSNGSVVDEGALGGLDSGRYAAHRCRMATRYISSHPGPYSDVGTACLPEYSGQLAPWSVAA